MKKLLLMLAAVVAIGFVSCDTKSGSTTEGNGADSTAFTIEKFTENLGTATDSTAIAGLLDQANTEVQALFAKGDTLAAQNLIQKIKEVIETNKEKLVAIVPGITEMVSNAITLPEGLKDAAVADGDSLKNAAVDAATGVANDLKEAANEKVNEAANKVVERGKEVVEKGAEKAKEGADKVKEGVNKAAEDLSKKIPH